MAGRMINGAVAFSDFVRPARDMDESGAHRVLPVLPELSNLLPSQGLRRGSTVAIGLAPPASASRNAGPSALWGFDRSSNEVRAFTGVTYEAF